MNVPPPHDWHAPILMALARAYARYRDVTYIEVGVDRGHTFRAVAPLCARAHAVDVTFEHAGVLGVATERWHMPSDEFFVAYRLAMTQRELPAPDLIFIDGDHTAAQVHRDLLNALTVLADDGTIALHDTHPAERRWLSHCADAYKAVAKALRDPSLTVWTLPLFPGLTLISRRRRPFEEA